MKVTDAILGEHGAMKPLLIWLWKSTAEGEALPPGWIQAQAEALTCLLAGHARLETELLFRFLPKDHPWVIHVIQEHGEIHRLLEQARAGSRACLRRAADLAFGHFDEEERHVIPLAVKSIPAARLEALGAEWAKARKVSLLSAPAPDQARSSR